MASATTAQTALSTYRFPDDLSLPVFLSFSLWSAGRGNEAVALLARRLGDGTGYERAIGEYADDIARSSS